MENEFSDFKEFELVFVNQPLTNKCILLEGKFNVLKVYYDREQREKQNKKCVLGRDTEQKTSSSGVGLKKRSQKVLRKRQSAIIQLFLITIIIHLWAICI